MAEPPKHDIAVLEDEEPPEVPPAPPAPSLFEGLRKFIVPVVLVGTLFTLIVGIGLCIGFAFVWRDPPPEPPGGTLVVVPFVVQGEDPTVADAFVTELYAGLQAEPRLVVTPKAEAESLKDDPRSLAEIGQELGVRYLIQGEVKPTASGEVRVKFSLVDAEKGGLLVAKGFTEPMAELTSIDDEIVDIVLTETRCKGATPE